MMALWEVPDNYAGFSPDGDCVLYTRTRDSDSLTESNWDYMIAALSPVFIDDGNPPRTRAYIWRASHWACGWIEYMMVPPDCDKLATANAIAESLASHPVLDDDDYSQREYDAVQEYWQSLSVRERVEYCKTSRYESRRDWCDGATFYAVRDMLAP